MFSSLKLVDLSHELSCDTPTWTGGCGFQSEIKMDYSDGLRVQKLHMHAGIGTHMDAPSHFCKEGKSLAELEITKFIIPLYVIKKECTEGEFIDLEVVEDFLEEHGPLEPGSFVAFCTGWSKKFSDKHAYRADLKFPGVTKLAVERLLDEEICGIGIDTLSPDGSDPSHPVHHLVLPLGLYIIENLNQLEELPACGAYLIALPLKIKGGTEGPIRAIAFY